MIPPEIDQRILDLLDGSLGSDEKQALQAELMADSSLMEYYLAYARLDNMLHLKNVDSHVTVLPVERIVNWQRRNSVKVACLGAAAAILLIGVLMKFFLVEPIKPLLVFRVSDHSEFVLGHSVIGKQPEKTTLEVGSDMKVISGVVELTFKNGVKSIITAPAHFTLHEEGRLYLDHGIAWFLVPKGAEGFTVVTPDVEVVDLGTEFGVISSHDQLDEVHVFQGLVRVNNLNHLRKSDELKENHALMVGPAGRLNKTALNQRKFLSSLPMKGKPRIVYTEQFNDGLGDWTVNGAVHHEIGDFGLNWRGQIGDCVINTLGNSDHSAVIFDARGKEIAAEGEGYVSIGSQKIPGTKISTDIQVYKGLRYRVYFRYAGSHPVGKHRINATFSIGEQSVMSGAFEAPAQVWKSGFFTFTPKMSGMAQLTFDDTKTTHGEGSDLLLDSVLVSVVPASSSDK